MIIVTIIIVVLNVPNNSYYKSEVKNKPVFTSGRVWSNRNQSDDHYKFL